MKGVSEMRELFSYVESGILSGMVELDITLARGLNYYTGTIMEVKSADVSIGSICGGGRYDNLTGVFGMDGISGVGISFGADRIYDVMKQSDLFTGIISASSQVLVINFGQSSVEYAFKILELLRNLGVKTEFYPDPVKIKKQMTYADNRKIPFIIIPGEDELKAGEVTVKNMASGKQKKIPFRELKSFVLSDISPLRQIT